MANRNSQGREVENRTVTVGFDGILQTSVRAKLVTNFMKYILYHRQQIPLPLDELQRDEKVSDIRHINIRIAPS